MRAPAPVTTGLQVLAILVLGLLAGSMFGIWRGYDIGQYSAATFLEVHKGAVHGLNDLLPAMGLGAIVLVVILAFLARGRWEVVGLYLSVALLLAIAGLTTRLFNQPINAEVLTWSIDALPTDWATLRNSWWQWHLVRLAAAVGAHALLVAAVFLDRSR